MKKKRILVVDDEPDILFSFTILLQSNIVTVDSAENLQRSMEMLRRYQYQVVITDYSLKGSSSRDGLELLRHVKLYYPHIKLIMITAYGSEDVRRRAGELGADYYFEKPVSPGTLRRVLAICGVDDAVHHKLSRANNRGHKKKPRCGPCFLL